MLLGRLERRADIEPALISTFERMLAKYREAQATVPELAPKPKPKRDWRRKRSK
jgi:hypothetical protein